MAQMIYDRTRCRGCSFARCAHYTFTDIDQKDIMVIGDISSVLDIKHGRCMEGDAAQILKDTMSKVGLPNDDGHVHYTTAIKCAVPRRKGKAIPVEPIRNCRSFIVDEIRAVNPKIVLVLGKVSTQTVFGDTSLKITSMYGRVYEDVRDLEGFQIIPIMHPALIKRAPKDYKPFLAELQLVANIYKGGGLYDPGETNWQVLKTEEECLQAIKFLQERFKQGHEFLSADIETTDLDYRVAEFCVLGVGFAKNKVFVIPREMRHMCDKFFKDLDMYKWIWQHGKYDTKVMWRRKLGTVPLDEDTIYMHYVLDETSAHDLGYLTKTYLQAKDYKYKMNQEFKAVTLETYDSYFEALCERVAVDCDYTLQLREVFEKELSEAEGLHRLYHKFIMPAARFLTRVEQNGMMIQPPYLEKMGEKYEKLIEDILVEIQDMADGLWDPELYMMEKKAKSAPEKFNPGSSKQMSWMVFNRLKLKPRRRKGDSTDADVLGSIEPQHPLIAKVLEYRGVKKEYSTYVLGLLKKRDVDCRVRTNFGLHVTATGRLSSKEPNVQNIPSYFGVGNVRRAFVPAKGKILMEVDYSGAELRWLAALSGDQVLLEIFKEGRNLHDETSKKLFGPNFTKQDRMRAKAVNFGIPYGREAKSLADEFNIPIAEAQQMLDAWLDGYPGARDYLAMCAQAVIDGKYLETPNNRRRRFGLVTPESLHGLQNEARNFPIQSISSDSLLESAMEVEPRLAKEFDTEIINLIHDSMLLEVPQDPNIVREVSRYVSAVMAGMPKKRYGVDVPFHCDTDLGPTWGDLVAYDNASETVETKKVILGADGEKIKKTVMVPYGDWIKENYDWDLYNQSWYLEREII